MQPPPRKGNYAKFLKNLHTEQINKLVLKNQHECDLLEDIRTFTTKKCALEKSYSDALLKISSAYLNKKIPNIPDIKLDGGDEKWNMWNVWRTVLEENEKLARARLAAVEVFQQQIAEDSKLLKAHKVHAARKCVEQLATVQKELQTCVQDIDKTKKLYFDEEHSAHDVRDKARDIEEKLKKKKGSFFQSITSLQKNSAKVSSKREQLEEKSAGARNDYLLCLAAANAHQTRYFVVDLQLCMATMESSVYEKVAEYILLMGRTELLTCSAMQNSYSKIRDQAKQLTREYNLQCCYLYYPVLKQHIQYDFEPCDNDPINVIAAEHESASATLAKEAKRWANKIVRENAIIKESVRKLQLYNALRESGQKVDPNDPNGPDLETRIEELKQDIRKAETNKMKAESRMECLKAGGVHVDGLLQEAELLSVQGIQRSASSLSFRTEGEHLSSDSFYDSDFADGEAPTTATAVVVDNVDSEESQADQNSEIAEVDAMLENERQRIEQLTADWDDPTEIDWGTDGVGAGDEHVDETPLHKDGPYLKCTALYSYTAQNPDELTIVENEQLEVVGDGDGDGWLKARNYRGEEGFVPHNYLDVEKELSATTPGSVLQQQISFSSVDYTIATNGTDEFYASETISNDRVDAYVTSESARTESVDETKSSAITVLPSRTVGYCIALYDYEGQGDEELTFEEGTIIKLLSKCAHSIDDGWWQGQLDDRIGNFPSLVVEECDEYGEPVTSDLDGTPPLSAPPVFTPPEPEAHLVEAFLLDGDQDIPESAPPSEPPPIIEDNTPSKSKGFSIELSHSQQEQYGSQFDNKQDTSKPSIAIVDTEGQIVPKKKKRSDEYGLGVAQIVITAATPMIEDNDNVFPVPEEEEKEDEPLENIENEQISEEIEKEITQEQIQRTESTEEKNRTEQDEVTADSAHYVISSSTTGSDGDTTGPSTAENSVSQVVLYSEPEADSSAPKQLVGGRASIPDELELHQLERLQNLRESNA